MSPSLFFAVAGVIVTAAVAYREHAGQLAARRSLLDRCVGVLRSASLAHGGDGFPILDGYWNGRFIRAELFPESMALRRLPQLWLKLTRIEVRTGLPEFSILVRPSGTEFYSLTDGHTHTLRPPQGLAQEIVVRGSGPHAQRLLDAVAPVLAKIFADPRIKEVAVTAKGLRLIWQAAEGQRGHHLLLRQCRFENAQVTPDALAARLADLDRLNVAIEAAREVRAA
jgi:hypothetical protein